MVNAPYSSPPKAWCSSIFLRVDRGELALVEGFEALEFSFVHLQPFSYGLRIKLYRKTASERLMYSMKLMQVTETPAMSHTAGILLFEIT